MTPLPIGKRVRRVVPSAAHDARKSGDMVVAITMENGLPEIELRPARTRHALRVGVDALWSMLTKAEATRLATERAAARKARRKGVSRE